jgi:hypothetical protein
VLAILFSGICGVLIFDAVIYMTMAQHVLFPVYRFSCFIDIISSQTSTLSQFSWLCFDQSRKR